MVESTSGAQKPRVVPPQGAVSPSVSCRLLRSSVLHRRASSSVVEGIQALRRGEKLTKEAILQELLPDQKHVLLAAPLLDFGQTSTPTPIESKGTLSNDTSRRYRKTASPTKKWRSRHLAPLATDCELNPGPPQSPIANYHVYTMKIWEDKVFRRVLSIQDAVYLLIHEESMKIIESALLSKASGMDMAQLMEVEMALDQLGGRWLRSSFARIDGQDRCRTSSRQSITTVCTTLFENVWRYGVAFHGDDKLARLPDATTLRPLKISSPKMIPIALQSLRDEQGLKTKAIEIKTNSLPWHPSYNQHGIARIRNDLQSSRELLHRHGERVLQHSEWIQAHCVDEIRIGRSPMFREALKNQAALILANIFARTILAIERRRFRTWYIQVQEQRCRSAVGQYCRLKCASKVLTLARRHLRSSLFACWKRWKQRLAIERKMERLASALVIQGFARCILAKRRVSTYHLDLAATTVQSAWRGFYCRKLLNRRRRYAAYSASSSVVQRAFRAYHNRCQFAINWGRHKASRCITRSLRRYCAKRRLFKSWCQRVAQFHSAAVIQLWIRKTLERIRADHARKIQQTVSALTLQRFFRYARFILTFSSRVHRVALKKRAAAVTLQNAYRAKLARARFYALKDQLEAQRRQQILKMMWDNAYATTIQRSWRKRRLRRRKLAV